MGNQASLRGKDRIGAVLYSELRRKYDSDGTAVDDSSLRLLVSKWRNAATLRQSQISAVTSEPTGSQSNDYDRGHCDGGIPPTDRVSLPNVSPSEGSAFKVYVDNCVTVGDPHMAIVSRSCDATKRLACSCAKMPEHSCGLADSCATCMTSISATLSSSHGKEDTTSLKYSEPWSDASDDDGEGEEAISTADPFDGDYALGQITPLPSAVDYHPLVDLLPRKSTSPLHESVSNDRFSRLQSELDAVYAEARDIELCISRLSRKQPPTVTEVGRLQRALSSVETYSDYSISQDSGRAAAVLKRYSVASLSKGDSTRMSAPDALVAWSDDSCQPAQHSPMSMNKEECQNSADPTLAVCRAKEWSHGTYVDEACSIMKCAYQEHRGSTADCHQDIVKGYQHIMEDFGCGYLYAVRADYYGAIRSCLAGVLLRGLPLLDHLQSFEQAIKSLHECFDNYECLHNWGCARDAKLPKGDIIALLEQSLQVLYDQCYQTVICPAAVREHLVLFLMNDSARDQASMEAVKALLMLRAFELHRAVAGAGGDALATAPDYARLLFTRDTSRDPGTFFTNHLNGVGIMHGLEQEHMPLLADTLGTRLQIFRPSRFGQPDFVLSVSTDLASMQCSQDSVIRLVAEDELRYGVATP